MQKYFHSMKKDSAIAHIYRYRHPVQKKDKEKNWFAATQ